MTNAFETLVNCGMKGESLAVLLRGIKGFIEFLYNADIITETIYKDTKNSLGAYSNRVSVTQRSINVSKRRQYTNLSRQKISDTFSWMDKIKPLLLECIKNESELDSNSERCFVSYIIGIILRFGNRPQVAINFTTEEYLASQASDEPDVFFVSNIKSQETGSATFKMRLVKKWRYCNIILIISELQTVIQKHFF